MMIRDNEDGRGEDFEMGEKTIGLGILVVCVMVMGILIVMAIGGFDAFAGQRRGGMKMDPDRVFIEQMIPHHQDAIDMGNLALVSAEHMEIRQLAENVIRDQSREIAWMRTWYKAWYGTDVPYYQDAVGGGGMHWRGNSTGMMSGGMGERMTDLGQLANATPFDKEFIEQMVPHHQMAIMMAQMTLNSDRKEMRDLGNSIIRSQSSEVDQMLEWYYTWYGTPVKGFSMMDTNRRF
jgi:uncharacterized protein (DUF305 family)